jgi:hypothetical protein
MFNLQSLEEKVYSSECFAFKKLEPEPAPRSGSGPASKFVSQQDRNGGPKLGRKLSFAEGS